MTRVGAIVLAGGRSSRFGADKLAVPLDGRPILWLAIQAVRAVATEVVVAGAPGARIALPPGTRLVHDPEPFEGPLAGVGSALRDIEADIALVVGGDMPRLRPAVLSRLLEALADQSVDAAVLGSPEPMDPRTRPLPMAIRCAEARTAVDDLLAEGVRRLGALPDRLAARPIPAAQWRLDDPDGASLRDVDVPADLER